MKLAAGWKHSFATRKLPPALRSPDMKLVIFGLTISSSWGNGHATLWRALCRALHRRGHEIVFFEHDVNYYAAHRDLWELEGTTIVFYDEWTEIETAARRHL